MIGHRPLLIMPAFGEDICVGLPHVGYNRSGAGIPTKDSGPPGQLAFLSLATLVIDVQKKASKRGKRTL